MDPNGRVKLSAEFLRDFVESGGQEVVLYCILPEGAVGIYPPETWEQVRREVESDLPLLADSLVYRRRRRQFGALSQAAEISGQGRITIPPMFRQLTGLESGLPLVQVGVENGIELWTPARWEAEMQAIQENSRARGARELSDEQAVGSESKSIQA